MSCKKRAAGAGGGGGEEPDLSGSEGLEANTELPRASLEQGGLRYLGGPSPRADGKWGGAGGRLGKGARRGVRWGGGENEESPGAKVKEPSVQLKGT